MITFSIGKGSEICGTARISQGTGFGNARSVLVVSLEDFKPLLPLGLELA
jgi:hypothetical protein